MNEELKAVDVFQQEDVLIHEGRSILDGAPGVGSGRYQLGSGDNAYQHTDNLAATVSKLRKHNMKDPEIARHLGFKNSSELRAVLGKNKEAAHAQAVAGVQKLKEKGLSNVAIAQKLFKDPTKESTVRNLLKEANSYKEGKFAEITNVLKKQIETTPYLDVGKGIELSLGCTEDRLKKVLTMLEQEGYRVHDKIVVEQYGKSNGQKTTVKVLTKGDISDRDVYKNLKEIKPAGFYQDNDVDKIRQIEPPRSVDPSRVMVKYAEEGGTAKDGVIEIRPGVEDLSLGRAHYAQVRIAVGDSHYLKGMAIYSDDLPPGVDIRFNTNKHEGTPMLGPKNNTVLKPLKMNKDGTLNVENPFGASIKTEKDLDLANESEGPAIARQRHYIGADGQEHLSCINIVNEEGSWDKWSKTISAQMLSKQPAALAKQQLDLTYRMKQEQLGDIMALTNPTVKKKLLLAFADQCEADAVSLKAYGFPGQVTKVILPVDTLSDTECYCPEYPTGTPVVLIRFPHAGRFEIPALTVNNDHADGKRILGQAQDAIGINAHTANHLSGADFDGDTVLVIPNPHGDIKTMKALKELQDFDPKEEYRGYTGMKKISERTKQIQMGVVTNLITDMTVAKAPIEDIIRAVRHSMVIIDAEKHGLDWKRSEKENGILELKQKYQQHLNDDKFGGSTSLLSRAKSQARIPDRRMKGIDPETGAVIYENTGKVGARGGLKMIETTQMAVTDNAETLISRYNSPQERVYATYANQMKQMALDARKAAVITPLMKKDPAAAREYAEEIASLTSKLRTALKNKPLERQAQILANVEVKQYIYDNPEIKDKPGDIKKLKGRTLNIMRQRTGANKTKVTFTDREWEAISKGAISDHFLRELLNNADDKQIKQLAMPRERKTISGARLATIRRLYSGGGSGKGGYTQAQIAEMLDLPVSAVKQALLNVRKEE